MAKENKYPQSAVKAPITEEIEIVPPAAAVVVADSSAYDEFGGYEDKRGKDDLVIGRYRLVQAMTQGKRDHGLQDGQIYDAVTKVAYDSVLVVPILETRSVVERRIAPGSNEDGKFIAELQLDDPRVVAAVKANGSDGYKFLKSLPGPDGSVTKFMDTRNVHVVFLQEDGVTPSHFGVLQFDSTNIQPLLQWKDARVRPSFEDGRPFSSLPIFAFRTYLDGQGVHPKKNTQLYRFSPFPTKPGEAGGNWKQAILNPSNPKEKALLTKCVEHRKLLESGVVKIAEYSDADDSETAQETAAF